MNRLILPLLGAVIALNAAAEERPRWELGVGFGGVSVPDYRGSDERRHYAIPFPYVVYRGDVLKADREGARAELLGSKDFHLDFNMGVSPPVSNQKNQARAGMPSRPAAIELGPALDATLYRSPDDLLKLKFRLPFSYGVTLGSSVGTNGWQTAPKLVMDIRNVLSVEGLTLGLQAGAVFGSRQRFAYYYDVAPQYATADRPTYRANGGYGGMLTMATLGKRFDRFWVGGFARYDNLAGAEFADSPLVKTRHYAVFGLAAAWVIGQSSEMVKVD